MNNAGDTLKATKFRKHTLMDTMWCVYSVGRDGTIYLMNPMIYTNANYFYTRKEARAVAARFNNDVNTALAKLNAHIGIRFRAGKVSISAKLWAKG